MAIRIEAVKSRLGALKGVAEFLRGPRDVLGVDIGNYAVKLVHLQEQAGGMGLKAWGYLPLPVALDAEPEQRKTAAIAALRAFLAERALKVRAAATSVAGSSVIVRYVRFPYLTRAELQASLVAEAEPFIPFDINEVQLGFHILGESVEDGQKKTEAVLVAAKKDLVASRLEVLESCGLSPAILDVDSFALENVHERVQAPSAAPGATLYLNIGHLVTNLSIIEGGVTRVVRDVFIAGQTLSKAVAKALACDPAKGEEIKRSRGILVEAAEREKAQAGGDREGLGVSQAVVEGIRELVAEVHRSVDFYLSQGPDRMIGGLVLSGGSASLGGLAAHLTSELKVPVSVLDPLRFVSGGEAVPAELRPAFGVAVGLALRRNRDWERP